MLFDPKWEVAEPVPVEVELEPWQRNLIRAADYIDARGWCQHRFHLGDKTCMLGAIALSENLSVIEKSLLAIHQLIDDPISVWNDAVGRTKEEVVSVLRKAATLGINSGL